MLRRLPFLLALLVLLFVLFAGCTGSSGVSTDQRDASTSIQPATSASTAPATSVSSLPGITSGHSSTTQGGTTTSPEPTVDEHVVYALGDDTEPGMEAISRRLAGLVPLPSQGLELFLFLGDVRSKGLPEDFRRYDAIWGGGGWDLRTKTASMLGNHETDSRKSGWIPYWSGNLVAPWPGSLTQTNPPYYSVRLGNWKFIILDTNSPLGEGSAQYDFLVKELEEPGFHDMVCGHHPRWSNGLHGDDSRLDSAWKAMCDSGAVAYLSGHDHGSQIQPNRDRNGNPVAGGGCIQLIAAGGGAPLYPFAFWPGHAIAAWGDFTHHAILRLTLGQDEFRADFIAEDGSTLYSRTFTAGSLGLGSSPR
ncbi:MAG: metallophosphoesterase [Actinobacteria bacterium]|nr:metallophosphoesterase [Actinomycetota bacterium]